MSSPFDFEDAPQLFRVLMYVIDVTLSIGQGHNLSFLAASLRQPFPHAYERMRALEERGLVEWQRFGPGRVGMFRATQAAIHRYVTQGEANRLRLTPSPGYYLSDEPDTVNAWYQAPLI